MLTEEQVTRFREQLEAEQAHVLEKINMLNDELAQNDYNYPLDWSDGALRLYSEEDVMFERNRLQSELAQVEHALSRIEAGTYGYSELSGKPIPVDASATFRNGTQYDDIRGFRRLLKSEANRDRFVRCFVTKLLVYANGAEPKDYAEIERIVAKSAQHDYRIVETVAAIIHSPLFRSQ